MWVWLRGTLDVQVDPTMALNEYNSHGQDGLDDLLAILDADQVCIRLHALDSKESIGPGSSLLGCLVLQDKFCPHMAKSRSNECTKHAPSCPSVIHTWPDHAPDIRQSMNQIKWKCPGWSGFCSLEL